MTADPIYERRAARRKGVVMWLSCTSFGVTTLSVYFSLLFGWSGLVERLTGHQPGPTGMLSFVVSVAIGGVTMWLTAVSFRGKGRLAGAPVRFFGDSLVGKQPRFRVGFHADAH